MSWLHAKSWPARCKDLTGLDQSHCRRIHENEVLDHLSPHRNFPGWIGIRQVAAIIPIGRRSSHSSTHQFLAAVIPKSRSWRAARRYEPDGARAWGVRWRHHCTLGLDPHWYSSFRSRSRILILHVLRERKGWGWSFVRLLRSLLIGGSCSSRNRYLRSLLRSLRSLRSLLLMM